jgi:hypothetical protein
MVQWCNMEEKGLTPFVQVYGCRYLRPWVSGTCAGPKLRGAKLFRQAHYKIATSYNWCWCPHYLVFVPPKKLFSISRKNPPPPLSRCLHALTYRPSPVGSHGPCAPRWGQARSHQLPFSESRGLKTGVYTSSHISGYAQIKTQKY